MLFITYTAIVLVAMAINLGSQWLVEKMFGNIYLSLFVGTALGFIFKYILDKIIIFKSSKQHSKVLPKYVLVSVFTTVVFWGVELAFYHFISADVYLVGGALGLTIGNTLKYFLDKFLVFGERNQHA